MVCSITKNKEGEYNVKAANGKPSILYRHLRSTLGNAEDALDMWARTQTPEFQANYSNVPYTDENGEPSMMYLIPQQDFLYYGKKDQDASAKAKDKINAEESLEEARKNIKEQSEIIKNTILKQISQFKLAESQGSRTNRYADTANKMARTLHSNENAVVAITNFASFGTYYLKEMRNRMEQLKKQQDTNAHLETLNELGQLLIIYNSLKDFRDLTGEYEKNLFQVQMEGFFDEFGIELSMSNREERKVLNTIKYYKGTGKETALISKFVHGHIGKMKNVREDAKKLMLEQFDSLIENQDNLTSVIDDAINQRNRLEKILKNDYYSTVTEWLWPIVEENQVNFSADLQISKTDFKNYLKQAQRDAGFGEYHLASLSTVNDSIAQALRIAAEQKRQDGHTETVGNMSSMGKAKKEQLGDQEIEGNYYDQYLKTIDMQVRTLDEDGNQIYKTIQTKALITPYLTEKLERDRDVERDRVREIATKDIDTKIAKLDEAVKKEGLTDKQRTTALEKYENAKKDRDYNISVAVSKAMNAWYETKYDIVKHKTDLINQKRKELNEEEFKAWYSNNTYQRTISADELEHHKQSRKAFRMIHPENLDDTDIKNSSYYKEGRRVGGKVVEYYVHEIYYGGEFTTPKDEYVDPRYKELVKDKFFNELVRVYNKSNNSLSPRHKLKHGIIPQIEKGGDFWDSSKSIKENASKMWANMSPDIYADSNEQEIEQDGVVMKISRNIQNVDGSIVKTIPVKFVSLLDSMDNLDTNLLETIAKFSAVTNRYKQMGSVEASARALKMLIAGNPQLSISAREIVLTDPKGKGMLSGLKDNLMEKMEFAVKDKDFRLNRLLIDFIDDTWYGDIEEKDAITILGKDVSLNKLSNFTSKWVSIQRLAGNLDSAISNLVIGRLAIFNESLAGKFYTKSEYYEASKIINKELFDGTVINDYMQEDINQKSLWAQMMIRHDAIQGEFSNEYGIKVSKKNALEMSKDFLFFSQNGMEYTIQKRSMLCVSKGFKINLPENLVYDRETDSLRESTAEEAQANQNARAIIEAKYKDLIEKQQSVLDEHMAINPVNKEEAKLHAAKTSKLTKDLENMSSRKEEELSKTNINYFTALDAYTRDVDGAIKVKDFLAPYFTPKVENQLRRRIQELNKKQQGIYAQFDKSQAQRHWLGKLALMFRKYLYSAYEHRFGDRKGNLALGEETYGYQRQFINKFMADFKAYGTWAFTKLMDGSASPQEQYAINKTLTEYAVWASFIVLFWLLRSLNDDDDEENFFMSKTAYIVKRTEDSLSEFALPFGIGTLVRTIKNPISSITLIEQIYEVFAVVFDDPMNLGGVYERDSGLNEKGDSKLVGKFFKVAPILRQWGKFFTPEDQLKYYTQKKTNI